MDDHLSFTLRQLEYLVMSKQPADICTRSGKVFLDAKVDGKFLYALMYGAGPKAMKPILDRIEITSREGTDFVSLKDIWIVVPMPKDGISDEDLMSVDISLGDELAGESGKTTKEIILETYRPKNDQEAEYFLRRYLAS